MSRKETKKCSGGFFPTELKTNKPRGRTDISLDWQNASDREESLSDPRWHKRPPTKGKQTKNTKSPTPSTSTASVADARELITKSKQLTFPKIIFGGISTSKTTVVDRKSPKTDKPKTEAARSTTSTQTVINTEAEIETAKTTTATQTETDTTLVEKEI